MQYTEIFGGRYRVYEDGKIYSNLRNLFLKQKVSNNGYPYICLYPKFARKKYFFVHRLVALAFIGELPSGLQVNHKDGDKFNNHYTNIEYVTASENTRHADALGLRNPPRGSLHYAAKLTESDVQAIRRYYRLGMSKADIARLFGIGDPQAGAVCNYKAWVHVE